MSMYLSNLFKISVSIQTVSKMLFRVLNVITDTQIKKSYLRSSTVYMGVSSLEFVLIFTVHQCILLSNFVKLKTKETEMLETRQKNLKIR